MNDSEFNGHLDEIEEVSLSEWKAIRVCRWIIKDTALLGVLASDQLERVADWVADYMREHEMLDAASISRGRRLYDALAGANVRL
jgi:hypothetical protein